jgi:hypothetical protein
MLPELDEAKVLARRFSYICMAYCITKNAIMLVMSPINTYYSLIFHLTKAATNRPITTTILITIVCQATGEEIMMKEVMIRICSVIAIDATGTIEMPVKGIIATCTTYSNKIRKIQIDGIRDFVLLSISYDTF